MGTMALIFGMLGGFCALIGVVTAAEVLPLLMPGFTTMFWLTLSAVLLLICIAFAVSQTTD